MQSKVINLHCKYLRKRNIKIDSKKNNYMNNLTNNVFSKKTESVILTEVNNYLRDILPETPYWKGKHTWTEMVTFRSDLSDRKLKSGFSKKDQEYILKWGGINRFKHYELLKNGLEQLSENKITYEVYSRISSMSKLFSFYDPSRYFILDARVALTINHLICERKTDDNYIPFNPSKSKGNKVKIALQWFEGEKKFDNLGSAYLAYNSLLLSIYKNIIIPNELPKKPEIIEMAIFSIADKIAPKYSIKK